MLTYRVQHEAAEPTEVRMLVQQRVLRGGSVAVRLVPIGTPLGEEPVYPQWLVGTPESMSALDEAASFTTPGFVPIDDTGRLRTEAASNEAWRVEARWLRVGVTSPGEEAAVGWSLQERIGTIREPLVADGCVRLERGDGSIRSIIVACAGVGIVERIERAGDEQRSRWQLIEIGERPTELH